MVGQAARATLKGSTATAQHRRCEMRFGAEVVAEGVRFSLWAPKLDRVELKIATEATPLPMRADNGWHRLELSGAGPGTLYQFVLPDGMLIPDPASRFQPQDVHGRSEVIDPAAYAWQVGNWRGRPWHETVLYELHIGAFTAGGTFRSAIERLDALTDLGITAIEVMPVADFPGSRNWGYDGVSLFAPESSYGRPEDMKAFIDAAHTCGLMVILDVVYNHFGPEGNYLPTYAPIFTDHHHTPWGNGINFDDEGSPTVRELILANVRYWIEEYNLDGLRLDAVHAIKDDSARHILDDIAEEIRSAAGERHAHLVLEDETNTVSRLLRTEKGGPSVATAQWNDDFHHAMHVAVTDEDAGYYARFAGDTDNLGRALAFGFAHPNGAQHGESDELCASLPPTAFISFLQNHDQVGNRAFGDRLARIAPREAMRAATAIYLLAPQIPMLFMGEEWGSDRPFPFFCDFDEELSEAVRKGRRETFSAFPAWQHPEMAAQIPDPTAPDTFQSAKLDWENAATGLHAEWRALYRDLLTLRRAEIVPRLKSMGRHCGSYEVLGPSAVAVRWRLGDDSQLLLLANLNESPLDGSFDTAARRLWLEGSLEPNRLGAWTAAVSLRDKSNHVR